MGLLNNIVQFIEESETSWDDIARALEINNLDIEKIAKKAKREKEFVNTITRTIWCKLFQSVNLKYDYYNHILKLSTTNSLGKHLIDQHSNQQGTINDQEQDNIAGCLDVSKISLKTEDTEQQEKDIPSDQAKAVGPSSSQFETNQEIGAYAGVLQEFEEIGATAGVLQEFEERYQHLYQRLDEIIQRNDELKRFCLLNEINIKNDIDIHNASRFGYVNIVNFLINNGADVNVKDMDGQTPLHNASYKGYVNIVEILLKKGADVNVKDEDSRTPLHHASIYGHVNIAELLINNGADVNVKDVLRETPLHFASFYRHVNIAQLLLNNSANVNVTDDDGRTPLHNASYYGHVNVAELLLNNGSDVNVKDEDGETPLHNASFNGHVNIAQLLTSNGADVNLKTVNGGTPLHFAKLNKHKNIITLLESKKSKLRKFFKL